MKTDSWALRIVIIASILGSSFSFLVGQLRIRPSQSSVFRRAIEPLQLCPEWSSLTTAIEYFDGSQVVDPVVVSNAFWNGLQSKLLSLVLGQALATVVFGILVSLAAGQIQNLGTFLSEKVFRQEKQFRRMPIPSQERNIQPDFGKLLICILIDTVGSSSELIPILGEVTDVVWAPIAGLILRSLYGSNILFALEFAEELLPFTDILPLATICWVVDTFFGDSSLAKLLNVGSYSLQSGSNDSKIIDVRTEQDDLER